MDFALNDEQLEFKAAVPALRDRGDPARGCQARRRGVRPPLGGHPEARKWGLHGIEHLQRMGWTPTAMFGVIYAEEMHWGCAGIALAISGLQARAAGTRLHRHPRADRPLGPRVLRDRRRDQARRLRGDRAPGRLRRQEPAHDRQARRRRVGAQRDQGLHHQRRDRRRPRRRRDRRPRARPPRPGLVRDPQGTPRPAPGQEGVEARDPRLAHRRGGARGLPGPGREPARRDGEARAKARARPLGRVVAAARRTRSPPSR